MDCLILEKEVYDKWTSENICYDLDESKFVTLDDRFEIAKKDYLKETILEDGEDLEENINDFIQDNLYEYPNTWEEFRDRFWVDDEVKYRSKSGDDIVVILFEDE